MQTSLYGHLHFISLLEGKTCLKVLVDSNIEFSVKLWRISMISLDFLRSFGRALRISARSSSCSKKMRWSLLTLFSCHHQTCALHSLRLPPEVRRYSKSSSTRGWVSVPAHCDHSTPLHDRLLGVEETKYIEIFWRHLIPCLLTHAPVKYVYVCVPNAIGRERPRDQHPDPPTVSRERAVQPIGWGVSFCLSRGVASVTATIP